MAKRGAKRKRTAKPLKGKRPRSVYVDPSRRLLTVDEVAAQLKIHKATIWRLRGNGNFPAPIMIGESPRWLQTDLDKYFEASRAP